MKNILKKYKYEIPIFIIFIISTYILLNKHELWFDESQSWLLSKNLSYLDIINQMKYEGHSSLYYFILRTFYLLGFNYKVISFFSWICCICGIYVLLFCINIDKKIKLIIPFTTPIFYYSCIFARPYSLLFLLLMLFIYFYNDRFKYPYIFSIITILLINTHLVVSSLIFSIFMVELYELIKDKTNIKERITIMIFEILGELIFFLQIYKSIFVLDNVGTYSLSGVTSLTDIIFEFIFKYKISTFISILLLIILFINIYKDKKTLWILISSTLLTYIFLSNSFALSSSKCIFIFYSITFTVWYYLNNNDNNKIKLIAFLIYLTMIPCSIYTYKEDYNKLYSSGKETSDYIKNNINKDDKILTLRLESSIRIYIEDYNFLSFINGDTIYETYHSSINKNINDVIKDNNIKYILISTNQDNFIKERTKYEIKLLYKNTNSINEQYMIYEVIK